MEMIENIRQEFIHQLDSIDWIDAETRVDAIRKAHNIEVYMVFLLYDYCCTIIRILLNRAFPSIFSMRPYSIKNMNTYVTFTDHVTCFVPNTNTCLIHYPPAGL